MTPPNIIEAMKAAEQRGFKQGLAYTVGWILQSHDDEVIAMDLLKSSGMDYSDLQKSGAAEHDLKPIRKALNRENRLYGSEPLKLKRGVA